MRIVACGGRAFGELPEHFGDLNEPARKHALRRVSDEIAAFTRVILLFENLGIELAEGGAPGADRIARELRLRMKWPGKTFPADWDTHGNQAGPIRNSEMVSEWRPQVCLAAPGGSGTADCVRKCRTAGAMVLRLEMP